MPAGALIGLGLGAAGSIASAIGGKSAAQKQMSALKKMMMMGQAQAGYSKLLQQNMLEYQKKTFGAGMERMGTLLGAGRASAKEQAKDVATSQQGAAKASLAARGLYNTTVYDTVSSGISGSLASTLSQIDSSYDQMLAGFEQTKTEGMLALSDKEMGLEQWYAQAMMGSYAQMGEYIAGASSGAQQFDMGGFGQMWGEMGLDKMSLSQLFGGE